MTLDVHPESLQSLGRCWDRAAQDAPTYVETLSSVGAGGHQFGRLNQFLVPALTGFVAATRLAVIASGEQWDECAVALRQSALDLQTTDGDVARLMRRPRTVAETSGGPGL